MFKLLAFCLLCLGLYLLKLVLSNNNMGYLSKVFSSNQNENKESLSIENVEKGGVIGVSSVGASLDNFDIHIKTKHTFKRGSRSWSQLEGDTGESTVWIFFDDQNFSYLSLSLKKIQLCDLHLSIEDLSYMVNIGKSEIVYNSKTYFYEWGGTAFCYQDGLEENFERLSYWKFRTQNESYCITIEKWDSGGVDVYLSESLSFSSVTVYKVKENF
ncbi:DUF4178 domain-containing protein [bacterium]|jgi:hypothetical protein|nr:DUF4178 domain-containing protein [bacterium]